jgi:hypothetical protein
MAYRASLTGCIEYMGQVWRTSQTEFLSVICYPKAKYYAVVTDEELANPIYKPEYGEQRLVLRCTLGELRVITTRANLDLWEITPDAGTTTNRTNGEQPHGDNPPVNPA